jgi:hypothetical protein
VVLTIFSLNHRFARHASRTDHWIKVKNPTAPAVKREAEEDWARADERR